MIEIALFILVVATGIVVVEWWKGPEILR